MKIDRGQKSAARILETASHLFARKGYSAVGIREIASRAGVNISMISYYYGGKVGILKAIVKEYFRNLGGIIMKLKEMNLDPDDYIRKFSCGLVGLIRSKEDLCRVAMIEMPFELPQVTKLKIELLKENMKQMSDSIRKGFKIDDPKKHIIIGPAFLSMLYSHFLLGNMVKKASSVKFGSGFYDLYCGTISEIFLGGIKSLKAGNNTGRSKSKKQQL